MGSLEIPQQLPLLIDTYLAQGGVGWPDIPGLAQALEGAEPTPEPSRTATTAPAGTATPGATVAASPTPPELAAPGAAQSGSSLGGGQIRNLMGHVPDGVYARFRQDVLGNSLSLLVLLGMIGATLNVSMRFRKLSGAAVQRPALARGMHWATLGLVLLGLGVSLYMAYVETSHTTAVCGPVGDCNTVQQSDYAWLFGVLPIGVIGVVGYAALGLTWAVGHLYRGRHGQWARLILPLMALVGTLFSIYLTFLEPFVIGATCLWCLSSALAITLILLLTASGGQRAFSELLGATPRRRWKDSMI